MSEICFMSSAFFNADLPIRPRAAYRIGSKELLRAMQASASCKQRKLRCTDVDGTGQHILFERVPDS